MDRKRQAASYVQEGGRLWENRVGHGVVRTHASVPAVGGCRVALCRRLRQSSWRLRAVVVENVVFLNRPPRAHAPSPNFLSLSLFFLSLSSVFTIFISFSLSYFFLFLFISYSPPFSPARSLTRLRARARECGNVAAHFKSLASSRRKCHRPRSRMRNRSRFRFGVCAWQRLMRDHSRVISRDSRGGATEWLIVNTPGPYSCPSRPPKFGRRGLGQVREWPRHPSHPFVVVLSPSAARDHPAKVLHDCTPRRDKWMGFDTVDRPTLQVSV